LLLFLSCSVGLLRLQGSMALTRFFLVLLGATLRYSSSPLQVILTKPTVLDTTMTKAGEVGVSYGRVANDLPDPVSVVQLLKRNGITMVRLYDANSTVLNALANTGIKVLVMLGNNDLAAAAASQSYALGWARRNVAAHYPTTLIDGVAVGNEVFHWRPDLTQQLVPAMINVQLALAKLGLADAVKVSTPIAFTALKDTFPPSSGRFRDEIAQSVMKPMLLFLQRTGSYLSMNPYPFFAYAEQPQDIPLDYALGDYTPGVVDKDTGLIYHSLLDAMMDATQTMASGSNTSQAGIRLTETGWSSSGQVKSGNPPRDTERSSEAVCKCQAATVANAKAYNNYVINRVLSGDTGTPRYPIADMDVYIFALFNENEKGDGPDDSERYFGLFHPNGTKSMETACFHRKPRWKQHQLSLKAMQPSEDFHLTPQGIPLDYALGDYTPGVVDKDTGLIYHSLLDAMMDATYYAIQNLTESQMQTMASGSNTSQAGTRLTETGWPSRGQVKSGNPPRDTERSSEAVCKCQAATVANAKAYNNYVINRVLSGDTGTPRYPTADMDVYIFSLFNENEKGDGPDDSERYFGLFHPKGTRVYDFDFHPTWCVANASVGEAQLQAELDYACGHGADCGAIQPGGECFEPNTRVAHASYAFNSYYHRNHRAPGTCDFAGAASIVHHAPSELFMTCEE
ncbi:hypothetical protein EJB05_12073, partial [Eragrostis curvula]